MVRQKNITITAPNLAYITDGSNNLKYYFKRDASGRLLNMMNYTVDDTGASPQAYWYLFDGHGSVIGLADKNGNQVAAYEYDAWGNTTTSTGSQTLGNGELLKDANPFRYSGYQYDSETGFYYLKSRYYSPELGRFITRDVIYDENLYSYGYNNPVNFTDANGYRPILNTDGSETSAQKTQSLQYMIETLKKRPSVRSNGSISKLESISITTFLGYVPDTKKMLVAPIILAVSFDKLTYPNGKSDWYFSLGFGPGIGTWGIMGGYDRGYTNAITKEQYLGLAHSGGVDVVPGIGPGFDIGGNKNDLFFFKEGLRFGLGASAYELNTYTWDIP